MKKLKIEGNKTKNLKEKFFIDATPDGNCALRILKAYREDCNIRAADTGLKRNPLIERFNKTQELRAKELDKAIEKLQNKI
jgi:hypothetical protein